MVKLANRQRLPLTPRGAGSGLSGGAIPVFGGIVLSLEKMNKVIEIDYANMTMTVETGIVTNEINNLVKEKGLFYAGYPMSLETCFLGGNIAENAGGGKAVKYGVTSRYIMGVELVTPTGEVVWLGGKLSKDVTGYDLTHLIVGSEGTLGIVTTAIIKLIGLPKAKSDLLVLFKTPAEAIACVPEIIAKGTIPTSMEFMDKLSVETSCQYLNESLPYESCGAMLLIEMDGSDSERVDADAELVGDLCMEKGAIEVYMADNRTTQERVWSVRRNIAEAFKVKCPIQSLEDIVVPTASIPDIIPELDRISSKYGISIPCYGHAGDGNLHATLVKDPAMSMEAWKAAEPESAGGTLRRRHEAGRQDLGRARHRPEAEKVHGRIHEPCRDGPHQGDKEGLGSQRHHESRQAFRPGLKHEDRDTLRGGTCGGRAARWNRGSEDEGVPAPRRAGRSHPGGARGADRFGAAGRDREASAREPG